MKASNQHFKAINSVYDYHALLNLENPSHPLMSIVNFSKTAYIPPVSDMKTVMNLYMYYRLKKPWKPWQSW